MSTLVMRPMGEHTQQITREMLHLARLRKRERLERKAAELRAQLLAQAKATPLTQRARRALDQFVLPIWGG